MSYCLAEGFCNTSNIDKYTKRLGIFAIISTPPYLLFGLFTDAVGKTKLHDIAISLFPFLSVIYTLLMAMLFLRIYTNQHVSQAKKYALMSLTIIASYLGDWGMYGIMLVWCFYEFRNNERIKWALYLMISTIYILNIKKWFAAGVLLFPLVILLYNGKRGRKNVISTWGFYVIYPIHFLILVLLKTMFCK